MVEMCFDFSGLKWSIICLRFTENAASEVIISLDYLVCKHKTNYSVASMDMLLYAQ